MLTSAVCFLTLQFGNSKKHTHTHAEKLMHTVTENQMKSNYYVCIMYVHCNWKGKTPKFKNLSHYVSPSDLVSAVFCDHTCSRFPRIKELITDGKVNGKKGRVRQTSLFLFWSISRTPYITVIQRKSLTDRYIQPQLSAFALDALFICVPIWRNPPNSPAGSKKTRSARERERERKRDGQTREKEVAARMSEKKKDGERERRRRGKHQNKEWVRQMQ